MGRNTWIVRIEPSKAYKPSRSNFPAIPARTVVDRPGEGSSPVRGGGSETNHHHNGFCALSTSLRKIRPAEFQRVPPQAVIHLTTLRAGERVVPFSILRESTCNADSHTETWAHPLDGGVSRHLPCLNSSSTCHCLPGRSSGTVVLHVASPPSNGCTHGNTDCTEVCGKLGIATLRCRQARTENCCPGSDRSSRSASHAGDQLCRHRQPPFLDVRS